MLTGNFTTTEVFHGSKPCTYEVRGRACRQAQTGQGNQDGQGNRREYVAQSLCLPGFNAYTETVTRRAQDADIVATSTKMSLKCPLSTLRIDTPCRSIGCAHNQCFDAASYLQLQEQAPTWTCPLCNKYSPFEHLAIDL